MYKYLISLFFALCSITASSQRTGTMDIAGQQCQYDTLICRTMGPGSTYMQFQFNDLKYGNETYKMRLYLMKIDLTNPYVKVAPYLAQGEYHQTQTQKIDINRLKLQGHKPFASVMGGPFVQGISTSSITTSYEIQGSVISDGRTLYDDGSNSVKFSIDDNGTARVANTVLKATLTKGSTTLTIGNINHHRDIGDSKGQLSLFCNDFKKSLASNTSVGVDVRVDVTSNGGKMLIGQTNKCKITEVLSGCGHTLKSGEAIISCGGELASTLNTFSVGDEIDINMAYDCAEATGLKIVDQVTAMGGKGISNGEVQPYGETDYAICFIGSSEDGRTAYLGDMEISDYSNAPCICASYAARNFGVYNAMWLDGGPSAEMTLDGSFITTNSIGYGFEGRLIPGAIAVFSTVPETDNTITSIEVLDPTTQTIEKDATFSPVIYGFNKYGERITLDLFKNGIVSMTCPEGLGTMSNGVFTATALGSGHLVITLNSTSQVITIPIIVKKYERLTVSPTYFFTGEGRSCQVKAYYTDDNGTTEIPSTNVDWSTNATQTISSCANGLICPGMDGSGNVYAGYSGLSSAVNVTVENLSEQAYEDKYINYKDEVDGCISVDKTLQSVPTSFRITVASEPKSTVSVYYTTYKTQHSQSMVVPDSGIADIDVKLDYDAVDTYPVTVDSISGTSKKELEDYGTPYAVKDLTAYYYGVDPTGIKDIYMQDTTTTNNTLIYNLQGMKVDGAYKGMVIRNGKKYIQ